MKIKRITGGMLSVNCYLLTDDATGETAVIDPGFFSPELADAIWKAGSENVKAILLTHGHFDHTGGLAQVHRMTGAKIYIGREDAAFLHDPALSLSSMLSAAPQPVITPDVLISEGDSIPLGGLSIRALHTPGHTAGSYCYLVGDALFSGDTLFQQSCGRTDFPTGDSAAMARSLRRLADLPGNLQVYPGHEGETTLDMERRFNPYMQNN